MWKLGHDEIDGVDRKYVNSDQLEDFTCYLYIFDLLYIYKNQRCVLFNIVEITLMILVKNHIRFLSKFKAAALNTACSIYTFTAFSSKVREIYMWFGGIHVVWWVT